MSIEKMEFVNIMGMTKDIDLVLYRLSQCGCFHMESAARSAGRDKQSAVSANQPNPYTGVLKKLTAISNITGVKFVGTDYSDIENESSETLEARVTDFLDKLNALNAEKKDALEKISEYEMTLAQVNHLKGMEVDFQKIFKFEHIKARFGRLHEDSYAKLPYYDDKIFYFTYFSKEHDYYWGVYFTPMSCFEEVDEMFNSLYFERIMIADFVEGDSEQALSSLTDMIDERRAKAEDADKKIVRLIEKEKPFLDKVFSYYKLRYDNYDMKSMVYISNDKFWFSIVGFVPQKDSERFSTLFHDIKGVSVKSQPADAKGRYSPPIKLKNNKFTQPFSLFVEMYGLPSYNNINPTALVAVTYMLLFGIMFGDLGQGLLLSLFGALMWKFKKWTMGPIIARVGLAGAFFGLLYGSVFGYEELLDPVYEQLGIPFLPLRIMDNVAFILIGTIALGVVIMFVSILINVFLGIKNKDYASALFSNNGIAGLVFFGSILAGLVGTLLGVKMFTLPYVLLLIVLPLIMMFMREPLACWIRGKRYTPEGGIGDFIASNFFEVFEFLLGYTSNTLSFVRVGGFALSHASMMLVVMALAKNMSGLGSPVMIVFGNVFVMGIEGLLVCIQTMRLEFYEIFSRFYSGDGVPFTPVKINYDETIE